MKLINVEVIKLSSPKWGSDRRCQICHGDHDCPGEHSLIAPTGNPVLKLTKDELEKLKPLDSWKCLHSDGQLNYYVPEFLGVFSQAKAKRIQAHNRAIMFEQIGNEFVPYLPQSNSKWVMVQLTPPIDDETGRCTVCGYRNYCYGGLWILVPRFYPLQPLGDMPPEDYKRAGNYYVHKEVPIYYYPQICSVLKHLPRENAEVQPPWHPGYLPSPLPELVFRGIELGKEFGDTKYILTLTQKATCLPY